MDDLERSLRLALDVQDEEAPEEANEQRQVPLALNDDVALIARALGGIE